MDSSIGDNTLNWCRASLPAELAWLTDTQPVRRLRGRNLSKASILFYSKGDSRVAVKTFAGSPPPVRLLFGRWMIARETQAYRAAGELDGLPHFHGRAAPDTLLTTWIDAEPLAIRRDLLTPEIVDRVGMIVDRLHARGVALGDLHHGDILCSEEGSVWLIDLASAAVLGLKPDRFRRYFFRRMCENDQVALAKLGAKARGENPDTAVARLGGTVYRRYRRHRKIRRIWDVLRGKHRRNPPGPPEE